MNSWSFDDLGRVTSITNKLGTFGIPTFDGITSRPTRINYPNGQATVIDYYGNAKDRRQEAITNLSSGSARRPQPSKRKSPYGTPSSPALTATK